MMRRPFFYLSIFLLILLNFPMISTAQNGWVSDTLLLTFRDGPGNNFSVRKTLVSNTPVAILEEQNGFYKVELQSEEIGWVDKKFIVFEPTKSILLEAAKKQIADLESRIAKLTSDIEARSQELTSKQAEHADQVKPLKQSIQEMSNENEMLKKNLEESRKKYETFISQSKNIKEIVKENQSLKEENASLSSELKQLKNENKNLFKTAMIKWFLAGVGVLLLGWIIGQSVSSKKRGYGSLLD